MLAIKGNQLMVLTTTLRMCYLTRRAMTTSRRQLLTRKQLWHFGTKIFHCGEFSFTQNRSVQSMEFA